MKNKIRKGKTPRVNLEPEGDHPQSGFKVTLQKPSKIKAHLDVHVVSQNRAKKTIAVSVHNHYKRIIIFPPDNFHFRENSENPRIIKFL